MRASYLLVPVALAVASTAVALPPGAEQRGLRDGANHRVGDVSWQAAFGRAPDRDDSEHLRMQTHLRYVRAMLAASPPTRPELAARRAELLGYLADYIAKGITPENTALPWRSPVFIDEHGSICAVGYLIERSIGRALPERIATLHRYDFLEAIAAAMPEVRAWIAGSGLTLAELASIQPGYEEPIVASWYVWDLPKLKIADGPYKDTYEHGETAGAFANARMTGEWMRTMHGVVVGKGTFVAGAGTWHSYYPDGKLMGEGAFAANVPTGAWTLYHQSGNVAAVGRFANGDRTGTWRFFYDTAKRTPIAIGAFGVNGGVEGTWKHYDPAGTLIATSFEQGPGWPYDGVTLLAIRPGADRVKHDIHRHGGVDGRKLHGLYLGREKLYVELDDRIHDADGNRLSKQWGAWFAADCQWSAKRKRIAHAGDITSLHALLRNDRRACGEPRQLSEARGRRIDATLHALTAARQPTADFVKQLVLERRAYDPDALPQPEVDDEAEEPEAEPVPALWSFVDLTFKGADPYVEHQADWQNEDLGRVLSANLAWYVEWPHIDGQFIRLFATLAGRARKETWRSVEIEPTR
ncbi:MAG: hypothetical protein ABI867_05595 [Kofleriaceae bacterium]